VRKDALRRPSASETSFEKSPSEDRKYERRREPSPPGSDGTDFPSSKGGRAWDLGGPHITTQTEIESMMFSADRRRAGRKNQKRQGFNA